MYRMEAAYQALEDQVSALLMQLSPDSLRGGKVGLEKESLRVDRAGNLAKTPHPSALGAPLTHPYITTDYSEALCELVTPPGEQVAATLDFLLAIHQFVYQTLQDEILWATSMPCVVKGDNSIPVAQYGTSNAGRMKTLYRIGLGYRYGRVMQAIAGIHFNYSLPPQLWIALQTIQASKLALPDFINAGYFGLIRNLQRIGWLIPYLFGASPAICKSFLGGQATTLAHWDDSTYYGPEATSLRMGNIGYQNNQSKQTGFKADYNSLEAYLASLQYATSTPYPPYEKIGVRVGGDYRQLNSYILQIENEYYSTIRPKQPLIGNEKPSIALRRRGVGYVELRSLDVNAFEPLGISLTQMYFLEALLLFCALLASPPITAEEYQAIDQNELSVAHYGRQAGLCLNYQGHVVTLQQWAQAILQAMRPVCRALDQGLPDQPYQAAWRVQQQRVDNPELTPSAQVLATMRTHQESFSQFGLRLSQKYNDYFRGLPWRAEQQALFMQWAIQSHEQQALLERTDAITFADYLQQYFAQA